MDQQLISNIVKEYPHMLKIVIYHNSYYLNHSQKEKKPNKIKIETDIERSLRRTKSNIEDIILCNDFDLWCTFTFDPRKVDRYNHTKCKLVMRTWLDNQKRNSPNLKYLIVPELHKDGAIHFHALMSHYNGKLKPSGKRTKQNQPIYSAQQYKSGYTQFIKLDTQKEPLAKYITKQYITKDMPLLLAQKRYWVSNNLTRPVNHVNGLSKLNLWSIVKNNKPHYINEAYEVQYHKKTTQMTPEQNVNLLPDLL